MTFLYPQLLWLLSLASVPIVLHLLSRIRLKRVNFSALYFLKDTKRERFSWLRLKEILLLIFRTLLIIFLFCALARPRLSGNLLPLKRLAHSVIIIDDSYSMGYGQQFLKAKAHAKRIISQLLPTSELLILTTSEIAGFYESKNQKLALDFIDSLSISYFSNDLYASLIKAQTILEKSDFANKEIFVITDLQKKAFLAALKDLKPKFPIYVIDVGQKPTNCAITRVFLSEQFPLSQSPAKIGAKIKNYSENEIIKKVILTLKDKTEEKQIKIGKNEEKTLLFESEIGASGEYYGSVRIEPDSLCADDYRYFAFTIAEKIPVLLISSPPSEILYLRLALAPETDNTFWVTTTDEKGFRQKNLTNFAVIGVQNPVNFTRSDWQRLNYYVAKGGKAFIALGNEPKDKTGMEPFLDYEQKQSVAGFVTIDKVQSDHPIFEVFSGIDLSTAKVFQWSKMNPKHAKVIAHFSDGSPCLLESDDHNYIIAGMNFEPASTNLIFKPIFLPLIQRIFFYLAKGDFETEYQVGDTITTEVKNTGLVKVKTPKEEYSIMPEIEDDKKIVRLKVLFEPGIYQIGSNTFAVNIDPAESDLKRVAENELVRAGFRLSKMAGARATDLTGLTLFLAFLFLVLEMLFLLI